jgi:hypothetical protein
VGELDIAEELVGCGGSSGVKKNMCKIKKWNAMKRQYINTKSDDS